ncbi:LAME_0H21044g1_1 [Lachancea meyersii CBS 8951]|uniref:LAME_0H21044g1_1 n=1 Tax=Lachancea meyersii CBS 8951 TaxID=1266667 RepID=A0A1G4KJW7_9SACH|nr:LAME_0H21044g1_1 [Lachancea meyersii CBS 8951]
MKVLIVFAHPEPQSLTGHLKDVAVKELKAQGHEVKITDLYAQNWKSSVDRDDFEQVSKDDKLSVVFSSHTAYAEGKLTDDVKVEQEKLLWADTLLLHFPLWWFSMPAILKGWVERVFSCGFAYGVGEHDDEKWGVRYGDGIFAGKRAMLVITIGGWKEHYGDRAINGPIDDVLYPINHGMLFYPGFSVLPPFALYNTHRLSEEQIKIATEDLRERMRTLGSTDPIAYRKQNDGDYNIPALTLRDDIEPGAKGMSVNLDKSKK